jgi:pilus assembly protein Flp/PilA
MSNVKIFFKGLLSEQKGQTLTEYALIMVLVAIVAIVALTLLGVNISTVLTNVAGAI